MYIDFEELLEEAFLTGYEDADYSITKLNSATKNSRILREAIDLNKLYADEFNKHFNKYKNKNVKELASVSTRKNKEIANDAKSITKSARKIREKNPEFAKKLTDLLYY